MYHCSVKKLCYILCSIYYNVKISPRLAAWDFSLGDSQGEQANAPLESPFARLCRAGEILPRNKNNPSACSGDFYQMINGEVTKVPLTLEQKKQIVTEVAEVA